MKLSFLDFWGGFDPQNNFFTHYLRRLLNNDVEVTPQQDADVVIYSCFGDQHRTIDRSKTKKIFFTGENIRPNFSECDHSFSFDFPDYGGKNIRIPLWYLYIDWFDVKTYGNPQYLLPSNELTGKWFHATKNKACCAVFSNPQPKRFEMLNALKKYMDVDGYGQPFGNYTLGEEDKYEKISQYKANICFENGSYPGYVTEKLFHARTAGNLAIYSGHSSVSRDFNPKGFVNIDDFSSVNECAKYVKYVLDNIQVYNAMISEPIFSEKFFTFDDQVKSIL